MTDTIATGRRGLLQRGAVIGLAAAGVASLGNVVHAKDDTLEAARKDAQSALDSAKARLDALKSDVESTVQGTYDSIKAKFDTLVA
ncbi:MAG: hypothetical protein QM753_15830 [Thermomicrobiales bacterium]